MRSTVMNEDDFQNIKEALLHYNVQWNQLKCVTTDRGQKHVCALQRLNKADL
jgi:hypothetical protein